MADGLPTENIFDQFDPDKTAAAPPAAAQPAAPAQPEPPPANENQPKANPFDEFGDVAPTETTATGALVRGAEKGALPAAAGLAAAGAGAELGGIVGTALGPFGAAGGALIGGVAGGIAGGAAVERAQHYLLSKLPDGFVDAFGLDEKKERLDQQQHPVASFVGGLVPYAVTMRPDKLAFAAKDLPENATALQTLMANPVTARLFGGGVMGGMEIANEKMDGQDLDWRKVGISTGFGLIWNKPTKFGEAITETGARPVRRMFGKSHPEAIPTVAQAGDAKVMGPGVTESVFQGTRDQAPDAAMTSQEMARSEAAALGDHPEPDVHSIARQMEPDLFARYEELQNRQRLFSAQTGPGGEEIPAVEHHLATTNAELDKLAPQVQAAYRRAAETVDTETVEPAPFKSFAEMLAAREGRTNVQEAEVPAVPSPVPGAEPGPVPGVSGLPGGGEAPPIVPGQEPAPGAVAPSPARTIGDQRAFIADDVAKRLIAAGRSEDEAKAAGQLIAARYITRAGRFEGKLGSPEELYSRESAAIAGPTGPAAAPGTPPARQVVEQTQAAGQASHEAAQAAQTAAKAAAAEHKPGIIARDFDTADRIKNEWRDQTPFKGSVDEFIAASKPNQEQLAAAGKEIAGELGLDFKDPGVKADGPGKGRDRLQTKASRIGAVGAVTDQVRAGFNAETPAQADRIVERLGQKFQITDEGWQTSPAGYFDRKVYVRFPDGMIGEVQIWPPGMFAAKEHAGGHALYEGVRELPQWHPLIPEFNRAQGELYAPVRAALSDDWKAALGSSGNEPNLLPKAAGESTAELRPTSAALTSSQEPLISAQASEGVQKAGKPSQETDLTSDMFGVPAENVGPHAAPVNAAIYASDKINDLSPAEQKREIPKFTPEAERTPKGVDQPAGVFMFNPTQLSVDAQRFQFKSGGDEYGVTGALRNVTKWDPAKAQAIIVWEANDGKLFVADGHQRAGLARRLTEQGKAKDIQLPGILYREKDGISADDIRAMAAVTNIANGSGSALDGAKVLRARPDLMDGSLPLSVGKGKQAAALARLSDEPFRMIVNDVVPEHYGAVVGELIPNDPDRQTAALKAIARFEPKNADEAAVLTQRVAQAELAKREEGAQASMFGDLETPESTAGEEMKIVGRAIADLKKDKSLFARVLRNAERIEETGSQIQREAAQSITSDAEIFAKTLTSDAYTAGPIRNELIAAAKDLKNGKATVGEASERIVSALRAQAEAHGADRTGAVERGAEAKEYAQRDLLESQYEPGAEGKPQALIPGVAPVTQRDLIQRAANAPLKPKVAQKEAGGLFGESMNQKELFQRISQVTLDKLPSAGESGDRFYLRDSAGNEVGRMAVSVDGDKLNIVHIQANEGTNSFGASAIRGLLKELRDQYPDVKEITGFRTGGARPTSENVSINLKTPSESDVKEFEQIARGTIRIAEGRRPIITLLKDANPSTIIHETGHQFLEELMRDADHPDAPPGLRDDAQTVRDWLGVKDEIKTKHHEKFARGFEQYLREGVAPSKELAGVFARFRDWLLSIYQSLKGLGTEIKPEIRAVFDRMLEMEPQRTVIAPERAQPDLLHDIHELDAEHTPPHQAEAAHDRIVAEANRYLTEQPPEIQNELQAASARVQQVAVEGIPEGEQPGTSAIGGEAIPSGAGAQPLVEGGGGPGAEPGGGARREEHGAEQPSRANAGAEGAERQRADARSKLGDHPGTALAPGPADLFGAESSPFTDRAGNIRLDTLNTAEDVKQAIRDSARENNDFIGDRRGVVTDGQVIELANEIGMGGAEDLVRKHIVGQAFNAEQVVALRKLLRETAFSVSEAAKKVATSGNDADVLAYAQARDRLKMVQKTVAGVTAEAGRALRAFRTLPGEADTAALEQMVQEATGKTLFQLKEEAKLAAQLDASPKMNKFMQEVDKHSIGGMILETWINGLLSAMSTHATNLVGNVVFMVQHFGPERALASVIGGTARALGREGTYTRAGELGALVTGAKEGLAPALGATGTAFRKGATVLLPGEVGEPQGILSGIVHDELVPRGTLDEATTMKDVRTGLFGMVRGVLDGIQTGAALVRAGGVEGSPIWETKYSLGGQVPDIAIRGMNVLPLGTIIRTPGRFLSTADTFFRSLNYSMAKNAIAYRMASDEGLTGGAFAARVADIRNNPPPEVMERARAEASSTTFTDKGGEFTKAINYLVSREVNLPIAGGVRPLKFVAPFTGVISRILDQTLVKRTPLGPIFSQELRNDLMGKNGNIAQDTATARMLFGSALMLGFGSLAAQGSVTGSGPKDQKEAAIWRLTHQAHSVLINGIYYDMGKLGPMGLLMGMAADLHEIAHIAEEKDFATAGAYFMHAIVQNILDQSVLQGPAELIKAIETPEQYGPQYVKSFLSSFVPSGVAAIARARDPYVRQTWTVIDALKAKLPGYSQELHPKIDLWGEPVPTREALGGVGMSSIYMQHVSNDPVNIAMSQLGMKMGPVEKKIRNVELNPQEYEDYARIAGRMTKQNLDKIIRSPAWETMAPAVKMEVINHTKDACREAARGIIMGRYPHIPRDGANQRLEKLRKQ